MISIDPSFITTLGSVKTSQQAWDTLKKMFVGKTRARILHLKELLSHLGKTRAPLQTSLIPVLLPRSLNQSSTSQSKIQREQFYTDSCPETPKQNSTVELKTFVECKLLLYLTILETESKMD